MPTPRSKPLLRAAKALSPARMLRVQTRVGAYGARRSIAMLVARQIAIQRTSQATTTGDFGGQNESRANRARTNENTANILATMWRDWRPAVCRFSDLPLTRVSRLRVLRGLPSPELPASSCAVGLGGSRPYDSRDLSATVAFDLTLLVAWLMGRTSTCPWLQSAQRGE